VRDDDGGGDVARVSSSGITVEVPAGWEAQIDAAAGEWGGEAALGAGAPQAAVATALDDGSIRRTVVHLANYPLPPGRGDYGGGAVEVMRTGDVFMALFEHDPIGAGAALFAAEGVPQGLRVADFDPAVLQRDVSGGSGLQRFFHVGGRAFCLYVVVGSHVDRRDAIPTINAVLASLEIQ
jgi:hypothetical protein